MYKITYFTSNTIIIFLLLILPFYLCFCTINNFDERYIELFKACENNDILKVEELINNGYNINYKRYISSRGQGNRMN